MTVVGQTDRAQQCGAASVLNSTWDRRGCDNPTNVHDVGKKRQEARWCEVCEPWGLAASGKKPNLRAENQDEDMEKLMFPDHCFTFAT
ncbi:hypothetical protein JOB18_041959 [Solea senegalensis]|uniref:Uncharacterized protein n=1 Tax=Solea senegalensis TaxID=28829 RepID=A0AAV6SPR6_SOLSE|nr:hypothetical protein JOB18_041959 [Solea senegalensis]